MYIHAYACPMCADKGNWKWIGRLGGGRLPQTPTPPHLDSLFNHLGSLQLTYPKAKGTYDIAREGIPMYKGKTRMLWP